MNFTTELPKCDPLVSYIVASAVKCEKFFPGGSKEGPTYRMHAVVLLKDSSTVRGYDLPSESYNRILCHVRKVQPKIYPQPLAPPRTRRSNTIDLPILRKDLG